MTKKELSKRVAELEARVKGLEIQEKYVNTNTEAPEEPKRWRADMGNTYYYVTPTKKIHESTEIRTLGDKARWECGNYFRTEEDAKNSLIYFALNSEYEYWVPGVGDHKNVPEWAEYLDEATARRWPKSSYKGSK